MTTEIVSIEVIMDYLKKSVEQRIPLSSAQWLDASLKLNILLGDLTDKLADMEMEVAKMMNEKLNADTSDKKSVSKAKLEIEATELYRDTRKLSAKIDQIQEFIRICKKTATLKENEMNG